MYNSRKKMQYDLKNCNKTNEKMQFLKTNFKIKSVVAKNIKCKIGCNEIQVIMHFSKSEKRFFI